jgi:pyruvate carboxylase
MAPYDFDASRTKLEEKYSTKLTDYDVMSHAMYPSVFDEFKEKQAEYGKASNKCSATTVS